MQWELEGLDATNPLRPGLLFHLPGRRILTDVAICHPLAPGAVRARTGQLGKVKGMEAVKREKYAKIATDHRFEQLPFVAETCGGFGPAAMQLIQTLSQAGEELLAMWTREDVIRQLVGAVAIAIQRGRAMSYFSGYDRCVQATRVKQRE